MENQIQVHGSDPKQLDGLTPHQLVAEIRQISSQYEREVPGGRRHWPASIRSRVLALGRLGVPPSKVGDLTGIPRATVFLWLRALSSRTKSRKPTSPSAAGEFIRVKERPTVRQAGVSPTVGLDGPAVFGNAGGVPNRVRRLRWLARCLRRISRSKGDSVSLRLKPGHRIFVYSEYIDLRAGFDKLSMIVREKLSAQHR